MFIEISDNTFFKYSYHVVNRGVTHGDELIYLFSAGVFDLTFLDWEIARVISNLWANFVIHGYCCDNEMV